MTRIKEKPTSDGKLTLQKAAQAATIVAALGALVFGYLQYSINDRLMQMSQTVAVSGVVVGDGQNGELMIRNTGRANLYLAGFTLGDKHWAFMRSQLVAANAGGDPGYAMRPGKDLWEVVNAKGSATLVLFLKDESGRKWVSELGFFKFNDKGRTRVRSYETSQESWELLESQSTFDREAEYIKGAQFVRGVTRGH